MLAPLRRRRSRAGMSLVALALAAGLVTALLTLFQGVDAHLSSGFRRYGPNLIVTPASSASGPAQRGEPPQPGALIPPARALAAARAVPGAVGVLYASGEVQGQHIIMAGADLAALRQLNPEWRVATASTRGPAAGVFMGVNAARLLGVHAGDSVAVAIANRHAQWRVAGTVEAGSSEDNQLLAPYAQLAALADVVGYSTIALRVEPGAMAAAEQHLAALLPNATAAPVRQITAGEAAILLSTRTLLGACSLLILITVGLCVAAALTTLALERRRDYGLMKALGASDAGVLGGFVGEAAVLGVLASVLGMAAGTLAAALMGEALFRVWLWPHPAALAAALLLTVALAAASALAPWPVLRAATPATLLRGDSS